LVGLNKSGFCTVWSTTTGDNRRASARPGAVGNMPGRINHR
jgi:hypothetical protein